MVVGLIAGLQAVTEAAEQAEAAGRGNLSHVHAAGAPCILCLVGLLRMSMQVFAECMWPSPTCCQAACEAPNARPQLQRLLPLDRTQHGQHLHPGPSCVLLDAALFSTNSVQLNMVGPGKHSQYQRCWNPQLLLLGKREACLQHADADHDHEGFAEWPNTHLPQRSSYITLSSRAANAAC